MVVKIKPEVAVISIGAVLLILIVWFFILWRGAVSDKNASSVIAEDLIKEKTIELAHQKVKAQADSTRFVSNIDSAQSVYLALERLRKNDFYFYQNKLNELKKVNTYSKRLSYLDSLERANGLK